MKKTMFAQALKKISIVYFKEINEDYTTLAYDCLKDFKYEVFEKAVKNIILRNKYMPTISELVEECEKCRDNSKNAILEYMNSKGYFKDLIEYEKAIHFANEDNIPNWLREDMLKYYNQMNNLQIETKEENLKIECKEIEDILKPFKEEKEVQV